MKNIQMKTMWFAIGSWLTLAGGAIAGEFHVSPVALPCNLVKVVDWFTFKL